MHAHWEPAVEQFWDSLDASSVQVLRLVNVGAKWAPEGQLRSVYRDTVALRRSVDNLEKFLPDVAVVSMLHKSPEMALLGLQPALLTRQVAAVSAAVPGADVVLVVERCPDVVLRTAADWGPEGGREEPVPFDALQSAYTALCRELPATTACNVVEVYPQVLLHTAQEIEEGITKLRGMYPDATERQFLRCVEGDPERVVKPHLRMGLR
ncbi:hypothetical protein CYMTET_23037 [Cymbomonas tetramitiformis]|uniref:Uncharacterized protein n=1 Tax=Cymbomonas tetramitiformis TaxID=36881 RepID=A0AAE0FZ12_9CHLO|nr:hypothetical protein CYMTET_23037 [Cymbomonas tetramitiformis]KAK3268463.1 hypothetical protein CYMTET_23037 [Cymbomonas tetramitiformis]KAK3268464.1 hypothetical protein CYMTET_23037 [Cymbomonas tetramitiformis]